MTAVRDENVCKGPTQSCQCKGNPAFRRNFHFVVHKGVSECPLRHSPPINAPIVARRKFYTLKRI
jgi:hypothetical protein